MSIWDRLYPRLSFDLDNLHNSGKADSETLDRSILVASTSLAALS